ncbi:hypothetical protein NCLIV_029530 [Neospora caninum Liverpool]|uniref:Transmembrane protein n=1 Tax=Neospora caninum (strain Liverpool) TaxID=572307 RepID=F0VHH1_NEOCL|nr:hypothetical protein NCLIV_029530 [Neospora caninum Liverpool]CBZ53165.1 hypothetical protein NCLIV_029530 [Neospora caninum Liverpool]CEL67154.1 TPA: hypothetical protein BN1204_029530 [Neospora caninum Liverpool]|eukprot:XP_003883197.1 hypothetical protein NCLIV_029530 [Neospora caninum Liverpool]
MSAAVLTLSLFALALCRTSFVARLAPPCEAATLEDSEASLSEWHELSNDGVWLTTDKWKKTPFFEDAGENASSYDDATPPSRFAPPAVADDGARRSPSASLNRRPKRARVRHASPRRQYVHKFPLLDSRPRVDRRPRAVKRATRLPPLSPVTITAIGVLLSVVFVTIFVQGMLAGAANEESFLGRVGKSMAFLGPALRPTERPEDVRLFGVTLGSTWTSVGLRIFAGVSLMFGVAGVVLFALHNGSIVLRPLLEAVQTHAEALRPLWPVPEPPQVQAPVEANVEPPNAAK